VKQQSQLRDRLLDQRLSDKSPLRLAMDDNKNNHRAETEVGLRLMGQPSRRQLIGAFHGCGCSNWNTAANGLSRYESLAVADFGDVVIKIDLRGQPGGQLALLCGETHRYLGACCYRVGAR
jgi:hypothetical protein